MIIQVDKEGKNVIEQFCHIALQQGGINNLNQVNLVLGTLVLISKPNMMPLTKQQPHKPGQPEQPQQSKQSNQPEQSETKE